MTDSLDFKTLLIAFTMIRLLQAVVLLFVWRLHRRYPPAREWAVGAILISIGTLLIAARDVVPSGLSILGGNFALFAGVLVFDFGVMRASGNKPPWQVGCLILAAAMAVLTWHALIQPSLFIRIGVFGAFVVLFDGCAAWACWNAPRGALRATQRIIGLLLVVEAVVTAGRSVAFIEVGLISVSQSSAAQTLFVLVGMAVAFAMTLGLAVLTSLIGAGEYRASKVRELYRSDAMTLIASGAPLISVLEAIVRGVEAEHPAMLCSVLLLDEAGERLLFGAAPSLPKFYNNAIDGLAIGPDIGACGTAAFIRERVICVDIAADPRWTLFAELAAAAGLGACWSEPILDATGQVLGTFAIYHPCPHAPSAADIGTLAEAVQIAGFAIERGKAERALNDQLLLTRQLLSRSEQTSKILDTALDNMSQGLAMFDRDQRLIVCNDKYLRLYAVPLRLSAPGTSLTEILKSRIANGVFSGANPEDYLRSRSNFGIVTEFANKEVLEYLTDGRTIRVTRRSIDTGGWVTTHEDVTELRRKEGQIEFMAHHDALTGLANRVDFKEKIEQATLRLVAENRPFSVLMLDLDRFKKVNDSLGHGVGDALLVEVSNRLRSVVGNSGTVARLGGDEFAIVQNMAPDRSVELIPVGKFGDIASGLAKRILSSFSEPFDLERHQITIGASIGIALAPDDGTGAELLLKKADLALYTAKSRGRNAFTFFASEMMATADARNKLEADLRRALENDEFEVHYQPLVKARTRKPVGVEALVRWRHPEQGLIAPNRFIPIAEDVGLINEIGEWVLRRACRDAVEWPDHIKVAVNLSAVQFQQSELLAIIMRALDDSGLPPNRLEVEVTESVLLDSEADHVLLLHQLKNIGITVALDDFGTGYSSLSYLKQFPFDKIKIDRSFTEDVTEQANSLAIVAAVIGLARALDMITTAEGIETEEQFEIMRIAGVTHAQGYLFGRPCPKSELQFNEVSMTSGHAYSVA